MQEKVLTEQQKKVIEDGADIIVIGSSAGCGKTFTGMTKALSYGKPVYFVYEHPARHWLLCQDKDFDIKFGRFFRVNGIEVIFRKGLADVPNGATVLIEHFDTKDLVLAKELHRFDKVVITTFPTYESKNFIRKLKLFLHLNNLSECFVHFEQGQPTFLVEDSEVAPTKKVSWHDLPIYNTFVEDFYWENLKHIFQDNPDGTQKFRGNWKIPLPPAR